MAINQPAPAPRRQIAVTEPVEVTRIALLAALRHAGWDAHPTDNPAQWAAARTAPTVVIALAGDTQWAHLRALHRVGHATTIALVDLRDAHACGEAIGAGAAAVLPREVTGAQVLAAVAAVRAGLTPVPTAVARDVVLRGTVVGITAHESSVLADLAADLGDAASLRVDAAQHRYSGALLRALVDRLRHASPNSTRSNATTDPANRQER
jgi:DNA-binding NarL/FixJ family response regulator